jgi:hypothetical protein
MRLVVELSALWSLGEGSARTYEGDHHLTDEATVDRTRWLLSRLTGQSDVAREQAR